MSYHDERLGIVITGYGGFGRVTIDKFQPDVSTQVALEQEAVAQAKNFVIGSGSPEKILKAQDARANYELKLAAAKDLELLAEQEAALKYRQKVLTTRQKVAAENALVQEVAPKADAFTIEENEEKIKKMHQKIAQELRQRAVVNEKGELMHPVDPGRDPLKDLLEKPVLPSTTPGGAFTPQYEAPVIPTPGTTPVTTAPIAAPAKSSMVPLAAGLAIAALFFLK